MSRDNSKDEYDMMESSISNVNIQLPMMSKPYVLLNIPNPDLTSAQHKKLSNTSLSYT